VDGHNIQHLIRAFDFARGIKDKPTVILARTVKGRGVSFMENRAEWHGRAPNKEEYEKAMAELK
jgi:transketolase